MRPKNGNRILVAFGHALRGFRAAASLTLEDLADATGYNAGYLGAVERGEKNISLIRMVRVCQALEIPMSFLVSVLDGITLEPIALEDNEPDGRQ